jgi:aspartate racemase
MEEAFFKARVQSLASVDIVVPLPAERQIIDRIIYTELCRGIVRAESKKKLIEIANRLQKAGVKGLILGCTELGLLVTDMDVPLRLFDTTTLHATAAVDWYLA